MHDEELEEFTKFQESNEELGLLYNSYKGLHKTIEEFMNKVEVGVNLLVKDPFKTKIELNDDIKRFKSDISVKLVYSPIEVNNLKSIIGQIKKFKQAIDKSLTRYSKLRNKISFGGNYIRAILNRPKVYSKEVDPEKYELENHNIRTVNRAMDWCEKALLDLFNLVDQDLNILTIVNRVYVKQHIYESTDSTESKETPEECMEWIENFVYDESFRDEALINAELFSEKSHSNLKYCYRVGFDANTGEEVAVKFELNPDDVIKASDDNLVKRAKEIISNSEEFKKLSNDEKTKLAFTGRTNEIFTKGLEKVKKYIKKYGMIDFVSKDAKVLAIFTKDGTNLNSVKLVPLFSNKINGILEDVSKILGENKSFSAIIKADEFKDRVKTLYSDESYTVGQVGGGGKYKTTKLLWDYQLFLSYKFSPVIRGYNPQGKGSDPKAALNYIKNDMYAKPLKEVTVRDVIDITSTMYEQTSCWGIFTHKIKYMDKVVATDESELFESFDIENFYLDTMLTEKYYSNDLLNMAVFTEEENTDKPEDSQDDDKKEKESEEEKDEEESKDGSNDDETLLDAPTTGTDEQEDEVTDQTPHSDESDSKEEDNSNEEDTKEDNKEDEKEPESMPKKADKAESSKNGVRRKKLYIAFIEWCKEYNPKNTFGSIFDKDAFAVTYPFVPNEMRYFYRLANPMVCTLGGNLTFFQASELRKLNANNNQKDKYFIFAATLKDIRVFNREDKKVYFATQKDGVITLGDCLGDTFDLYLQIMIKKGDILNAPLNEFTLFNLEDYTNEREN